jgi:hypothetical protein
MPEFDWSRFGRDDLSVTSLYGRVVRVHPTGLFCGGAFTPVEPARQDIPGDAIARGREGASSS